MTDWDLDIAILLQLAQVHHVYDLYIDNWFESFITFYYKLFRLHSSMSIERLDIGVQLMSKAFRLQEEIIFGRVLTEQEKEDLSLLYDEKIATRLDASETRL